jgi:MYXO-CTERM domain-containing protein
MCATLQFNLTVVGDAGAPAIATNVGFTSSVGAPSQNINNGPGTRLVGWFSNFDPLLSGATTAVGTLTVPIPAGATSGQTYTVQVINPSGTSDGEADLPLSGANGKITVAGGGTPPTNTPTATNTVVVPTNTPTATRTNTTGVPATATRTPTRTATRVPTSGGATPAPFDDDGGCQINTAGSSGAGWLLLFPAIGLLALRRRQR